jgi:predicted metal-dependent phosphoesterase TrpH
MEKEMQSRWMKADLHTHCNLDPIDYRIVLHSAEELIQEAARLRYEVLAITCHDLDVWSEDLAEYAAGHGITLIPGMEVNVNGRYHTLVYNFGAGAESLRTFEQIRTLKRPDTLVVAPHPFFPSPNCLRTLTEENLDAIDAIEISGFYIAGVDFNRRARRLASACHMPLVGNADVHQLWQLGRTSTWIYASPDVNSILSAVKQGRVRVESEALSYAHAAWWWAAALGRLIASPFRNRTRDRTEFVPKPVAKHSHTEPVA